MIGPVLVLAVFWAVVAVVFFVLPATYALIVHRPRRDNYDSP
jgi:hypothetical protein